MLIKITFKSHFKIKQKNKLKNKLIFVTNMLTLLLFSKIFFKNTHTGIIFKKISKKKTSLLKAPSRHKKFFHQVFYEYFILKVFFKINVTYIYTKLNTPVTVFRYVDGCFLKKIGSNVLSRTKLLFIFSLKKKIDLF